MRRDFLVRAMTALLLPRAVLATDCRPTSSASQGPYWRPGAPSTRDLRRFPTDADLRVRGRLLDATTCRPLTGRLEVWNADGQGRYDLDVADGSVFGRASLGAGNDGAFEFVTMRPAPYGNERFRRPAHVHFIVTSPGKKPLVTQLYFAGDPNLARDPLRDVHADLVVTPQPMAGGSGQECTFDIRLA